MKSWKQFVEEHDLNPLKSFEEEGYTLFFKKDNNYYAMKEESRIIFAKIKTKDTKDLNADKDKIKLTAKNIVTGEEEVFDIDDIKNIKVCDKKEVIKNVAF